jgi:hypothetical protein
MLDLLKLVSERKDKEVAADFRRFAAVQPVPFAAQFREVERANAIELALDRQCVQSSHD